MKVAFILVPIGLLLAGPALAVDHGFNGVRILAPGDAYVVAVWSACPQAYGSGDLECMIVKDNLGYDGLSAGVISTAGHVGHALTCSVTGSATGFVANAFPYPANLALADSIAFAYDTDGDTVVDTKEGGRTLSGGPTPTVSGTVRTDRLFVLNEGGFDVTVECSF